MGGTSAERENSLRSGTAIYNALKGLGYYAVSVDVGPDICNVLNRDRIEIAFLALHGGYGENGSMQGMLEVLGIPYTGSGVLASALAMDKEASKKIFLYHNIPVPPFVVIQRSAISAQQSPPHPPLIKGGHRGGVDFPLPWVVKPAAEGSSIGVSIVKEQTGLAASVEKGFFYGSGVLGEKFKNG